MYFLLGYHIGFFVFSISYTINLFSKTGLVKNIQRSNFANFIKHSSLYLPFLKKARYVGSFFVVRVLKNNVEKTDERISTVKKINKKITVVLSGKWNTCIGVAKYINNNSCPI